MRFRTRAFLLCFVPFALLLTGSFWAIQRAVKSTVRDGLRTSLRENHAAVARLRARSDLRNSRFLKIAGENAELKAGMQLLASFPGNAAARRTVEDQLQDLCRQMGFDFLMVSGPDKTPVAGILRDGAQFAPLQELPGGGGEGLIAVRGVVHQVASVPIDQGDENLGFLFVGERFDFAGFSTPAVLMRNGRVLLSNLPNGTSSGINGAEAEHALAGCGNQAECTVRLGGSEYLSLPVSGPENGYIVRSLQNVDAAAAPVQSVLNRVFSTVAIGTGIVAFLCSVFSSRSIVRPITAMISQLRSSDGSGLLPEFPSTASSIREIRDLTSSFNLAAAEVREGRRKLHDANVGFVGSLASALDARDRYTAGHSSRVSELSCATAKAMGVPAAELEDIRIGALLHDIGKIGISDTVLQKAGSLTREEYALIRQHPEIGRRILEGVQGFAPYLAAVELHHENWDGTGYPWGQAGEATPLIARIIHVSDAYDAMTTHRPYRRGMSHGEAIAILREYAGRHFDPRVVEVFTGVVAPATEPDFAAAGRA